MISAQTLSRLSRGKPVSTFPDHARTTAPDVGCPAGRFLIRQSDDVTCGGSAPVTLSAFLARSELALLLKKFDADCAQLGAVLLQTGKHRLVTVVDDGLA